MKRLAAPMILALVSGALVACGGGDSAATPATTTVSGSTIEFEADPSGELAYTNAKVVAQAGEVTIDFNNPQGLRHDVEIEDETGGIVGETPLVSEGSVSIPVELKPGTYYYFCTVKGHREAGMEGALIAK
jgi:plastocyanin